MGVVRPDAQRHVPCRLAAAAGVSAFASPVIEAERVRDRVCRRLGRADAVAGLPGIGGGGYCGWEAGRGRYETAGGMLQPVDLFARDGILEQGRERPAVVDKAGSVHRQRAARRGGIAA